MHIKPQEQCLGFTLVELLVVIAIIAIAMGGIGLMMKDGSPTKAVSSAATTLSSLVAGVRAQAALSGSETRLFIYGNEAATDRYMRFCVIAKKENNAWVVSDAGYTLPKGVYVKPLGSGSLDSDALTKESAIIGGEATDWFFLEINRFGRATQPGKILVSPGVVYSSNRSIAYNDSNIQGIWVSKYGIATYIRSKEEAESVGK